MSLQMLTKWWCTRRNSKVWSNWATLWNTELSKIGMRWKQSGGIFMMTLKWTWRSILFSSLNRQTTRSATESELLNCSLKHSMFPNYSSTLKLYFLYMHVDWLRELYLMSVMVARMLAPSMKDFQLRMLLKELIWVDEISQSIWCCYCRELATPIIRQLSSRLYEGSKSNIAM